MGGVSVAQLTCPLASETLSLLGWLCSSHSVLMIIVGVEIN